MKESKKHLIIVAFTALVFCICTGGNPCSAQDIHTLENKVETLQKQVEELKKELEQVKEEQLTKPRVEEISEEKVKAEFEKKEDGDGVDIGGAVRFNYAFRDYSETSKAKEGDLEFDIFRFNVDAVYSDVILSAEYRWYSYMDVIHHGWVGYNFGEDWQAQVGITQVPFGLLPYASHNWWFGIPYYVGFEDDYDMGVKTIWDRDGWNLQLGFFKNAEWGNPGKLERYSYDLVSDTQNNEETNQVNGRLAYYFDYGSFGGTEIGVSGQWGQIYNDVTDDNGSMWAAAGHINGDYGPFNLMLEAISYRYDPENPQGVSDDTIEMGAFGVSSLVSSEAEIYLAGLSYDVEVSWGPISKLTFYNDYSIMDKHKGYPDSHINTTGCLISAGPVFTYIDFIMGKNAQFLDGGSEPFGDAADSDDEWHSRFNINVGYYF